MRLEIAPPLPEALLTYLDSQAQFIVSVASQYRNRGVTWPQLLAAGQQELVRAIRVSQGDLTRLDKFSAWRVRQAICKACGEFPADKFPS